MSTTGGPAPLRQKLQKPPPIEPMVRRTSQRRAAATATTLPLPDSSKNTNSNQSVEEKHLPVVDTATTNTVVTNSVIPSATGSTSSTLSTAITDTKISSTTITNQHQEQMQQYIQNLPPLQKTIPYIKKLNQMEMEELEFILEFYHPNHTTTATTTANNNTSSSSGSSSGNGHHHPYRNHHSLVGPPKTTTTTTTGNSGRSNNHSPTTTSTTTANTTSITTVTNNNPTNGNKSTANQYDTWRQDWVGNLAMVDKEIMNPVLHKSFIQQHRGKLATTAIRTMSNHNNATKKNIQQKRQSLLDWACDPNGSPQQQVIAMKYIRLILQHVCTFATTNSSSPQPSIPTTIKKIFGTITEQTSIRDIIFRIRRVSYDPQVLQEDGWTIQKSEQPIGASGGPYLIGDTILSENTVAIIIAYLYDNDIGDLWKALYIDDEFLSFDLESEELSEAKRKYNKKYGITTTTATAISSGNNNNDVNTSDDLATTTSQNKRPTRSTKSNDFTVKGIEYGIVLAASYSKGARHNVYWPARIVHASETYDMNHTTTNSFSMMTTNSTTNTSSSTGNKRNSSKQKVDVIFLSPYWTSDDLFGANRQRRITESLLSSDDVGSKSNPLLMMETIDTNDEMIKEFPIVSSPSNNGNDKSGLDIGQLRISFRFTGLPKSVFPKYLDAHRLALALQLYAKKHGKSSLSSSSVHQDRATAGLFESHPMSVQVPTFPNIVLHLPFHFILSKLPRQYNNIDNHSNIGNGTIEPILNLDTIVQSMTPPYCWNSSNDDTMNLATMDEKVLPIVLPMPSELMSQQSAVWMNGTDKNEMDEDRAAVVHFMTDFPLLNASFNRFYNAAQFVAVLSTLTRLLSQLGEEDEVLDLVGTPLDVRKMKLQSFISSWSILKKMGEESLASLISNCKPVILEWRRATEKIFHFMVGMFADGKYIGNGLSVVVTDGNCNGHITSGGSLERQVRLPAAVKGARLAGAGCDGSMTRLITAVPAHYSEYVEKKLLPKVHDVLYLKRMKSRCAAARTDKEVLVLTDDSEGEGGEDTGKYFGNPHEYTLWLH